jgi:hypothetical protein
VPDRLKPHRTLRYQISTAVPSTERGDIGSASSLINIRHRMDRLCAHPDPSRGAALRRAICALTLALLATGVVATPAYAATTQSTVLRACTDGFIYPDNVDLAADANGVVHGFAAYRRSASCGNRIYYFEGSGTSWTSGRTALFGTVVSVAHDTTGTYLLYIAEDTPGTPRLVVAKRGLDGRTSRLAVVSSVASSAIGEGNGSIVARGGKWLVAFTGPGSTTGDTDLYQAGNLYSSTTAATSLVRNSSAADSSPVLTLGPDGTPTVAWRRKVGDVPSIRIAHTTTGTSWAHQPVATGPTYAQLSQLDVAVTAAGTVVGWTQAYSGSPRVQVADNLTGSWQVQEPPSQFANGEGSWNPALAVSGVKVAAGYSTGDEYPADGAVVAKRTTTGGTWTTTPAVTGVESIDSFGVVGYALKGTALTAVSVVGDTLYAVTGLTL